MSISQFVYGVLIALGLLDLMLMIPALWRAKLRPTVLRLVASAFLVLGFVLSSAQRLSQDAGLTIGLPLVLLGLLLFAVGLPDRILCHLPLRTRE